MQRALYFIHRWAGVVLALFMFLWFGSGLVIMYAPPSALGRAEQLGNAEPLVPQAGWLSLGEAWRRSATARLAADAAKPAGEARPATAMTGTPAGTDTAKPAAAPQPAEARLVSQAGQPVWLVEDSRGRRLSLSALDGSLRKLTPDDAIAIAARWIENDPDTAPADAARLVHLDTGPQDSAVRNHDALRPFHRIGVAGSSREILVSARTGEVVRDSTALTRAAYWAGNWTHLLRAIDLAEVKDLRRDTLMWLAFLSFAASLTGLVIGWQRWRPAGGRKPQYKGGRAHPYRDVWNTWHFWAGLIGGIAALLWGFSGWFNGNPFQMFSPANPSREELVRYQGKALPQTALDWQPAAIAGESGDGRPVVELAWRRLGDEALLVASTRGGDRLPQPVAGTPERFAEPALIAAVGRLTRGASVARSQLVSEYDSYYYARHRQGQVDRPLPVLRVDLADAAGTRFYLDPQDGRLLLRSDQSRRAYRWLWSALHHWDFGWLAHRPVWDLWMLTFVGLGVVLGATSVVLGWKRVKRSLGFKGKPSAGKPVPGRAAADGGAQGQSALPASARVVTDGDAAVAARGA
ncbi:PepSY domain-containing protein [Derxia gummosa]|uniref:PepSY domain-containing protein n=1 Tax=Derxia gummosa DSM 723 TaxID=1121388 RepID=A0A8B6X9C7_9BURK|nr:PepSY domain-containing protein [Derxia gummosa]